jgi:hypothetical protein
MNPQPEITRLKGSWRWLISGCCTALLITGIAVFTTFFHTPEEHVETRIDYPACEAAVREMGAALKEYNTIRGTDTAPYPSDIRQLDGMGITSDINRLLSIGAADGGGDWLYFWSADSENPSAPLLISPALRGERPLHILLTTDGAVHTVEPSAVEETVRSSPNPPYHIPAPAWK